jgi:hypothetical protein
MNGQKQANTAPQALAPWFAYLLSLNVAWIVVWHVGVTSSSLHFWRSSLYLAHLSQRLHIDEPSIVLQQLVWSLIASVVVLAVMLLLTYFASIRNAVYFAVGVFAVAGFPFLALCFPDDLFYPRRIRSHSLLLLIETAAILIAGSIYYFRKWSVPLARSIAVLIPHFAIWAWATGSWVSPLQEIRMYGSLSPAIWISTAFHWGLPLFGFFSSLAAVRYILDWFTGDSSAVKPMQ